jgi:hypothetical protein
MLTFDPGWRFQPPPDGTFRNSELPQGVVGDFYELIGKVASQGKRWDVIEHFKGAFAHGSGSSHFWSSSEGWADTDLCATMSHAAKNAPLFLEAFWEACLELKAQGLAVPDAAMLNGICDRHNVGYVLEPPRLILRDAVSHLSVPVPERPVTIAEQANELLQASLQRSEQLLAEGRGREAVQESLWALETVTTAFRGVSSADGSVRGTYFNEIVRDLRRMSKGATLERVLAWISGLHGYLSSPTGGGVRHGLDLNDGLPVGVGEARLFCNLTRSYISYLLLEHERLSKPSV